jgi:hypothetical protein
LKLLITYSLKPLQLSAIRSSELERLRNLEYQQESKEIDLLVVRKMYMHDRFLSQYLHLREMSNSALRQDIFAAITNGCKSGGFFVEFGACDGIFVSNTLMLERQYNWQGILSEPARVWHSSLKQNRQCILDFRSVWSSSNEQIWFQEMASPGLSGVSSQMNLQTGGGFVFEKDEVTKQLQFR